MADRASVIVKAQALLAEAQALPGDPTLPVPPPPTGPAPSIVVTPLDLTQIVCLTTQYFSSRYERYQQTLTLTTSGLILPFGKTNVDPGGGLINVPFTYPKYGLLVNGVERATYTRTGSERAGTFSGSLGNEADGRVLLQIVAYDASGARVAAPTESLLPFWAYIDRTGQAKDRADTVVQNGSFEWLPLHNGPSAYAYAIVPKTQLGPKAMPLVARAPVSFSTAVAAAQITRRNLVPATDANANEFHRPITTTRGVVDCANRQAYFIGDMIGTAPHLPMLDGPRNIATGHFATHLAMGRNGKVYGCDPFSFWVFDATGLKRTLCGIRHTYAANADDLIAQGVAHPATEFVGNWDASIPANERFPWESWGMAWDDRTLATDPAAPPIGGEQPHVGLGPMAFVCDRHGFVLKVQFDGHNRATPAVVTRFFAASDPWSIVYDQGVLYVTERALHRVSKWSADTGAFLGVVIGATNGDTLCAIDGLRTYNLKSGVTLAQARAQPTLAPEGLALQDGFLYVASKVQSEVRRVNLTTNVVQSVCRPNVDGNSHFLYIALSDGNFGPRSTVFANTFSNTAFGRPEAFLPTAGTASDGTALTNSTKWTWANYGYDVIQGRGGLTEPAGYPTAVACRDGWLACGSSNDQIDLFCLADATDPVIDAARATRGATWYRSQLYPLIHGPYGYHGTLGTPLPWGENADCDYWLQYACGHAAGD